MKTTWTKGLTPDAADELRKEFINATRFRERLRQLLEDKSEVRRKAAFKNDAYDNPSWAYQQADAIGYEKAILEVISLISE
jgi:hypothetical protein